MIILKGGAHMQDVARTPHPNDGMAGSISAGAPEVVFVYGALRSGTTLFRLMLKSHPKITNPGEVDFLFDHLHPDPTHRDGWRYDLEALRQDRILYNYDLTLPENCDGLDLLHDILRQFQARDAGFLTLNVHRHAGKIGEILPRACFIHLLRDPRDVARSSIGMGWSGNSYYGVAHWIRTEQEWDQAQIASDRVLPVRFETLMAEIEPQLMRICAFLGVPYDAKMLEYHYGTNFGPPDPKIAFGWKRKATPHEVALIEGRLGDMLEKRGYTSNGAVHVPGSFETFTLFISNRWHRWRYNARRYGVALFMATHLTRLFGLTGLHKRLQQRQEAIVTRNRR